MELDQGLPLSDRFTRHDQQALHTPFDYGLDGMRPAGRTDGLAEDADLIAEGPFLDRPDQQTGPGLRGGVELNNLAGFHPRSRTYDQER